MLNYYSWLSNPVDFGNFSWLISITNWEDSAFLLDSDLFFLLNLLFTYTFNNFFLMQSLTNVSFFDLFIKYSFDIEGFTLITSFFFDIFTYLQVFNVFVIFQEVLHSSDYLLFTLNYDLDTILLFFEKYRSSRLYSFFIDNFILYDSIYLNDTSVHNLNFLVYIKWFFIFFLFIFSLLNLLKLKIIANIRDFFFTRIFIFLVSMGFENRIQIDLILLFLIFVLFVWVILLIGFDDIYSETVELFHFFLIFIFLYIILFLLYKYSIHYFSFLENTVTEGFSTAFITKQMVRDFSNTFALFLRFFLLLFRLNIYDGLDDFLDSYYIFFCDFNEDSYFDEDTFHSNAFFYFKDNQEDNVFFHPNEQDWFDDLFARYYVIWGKFFLFFFFILEELFRVSLALYIFYLIIFEVHSVNLSYVEDNFFADRRN